MNILKNISLKKLTIQYFIITVQSIFVNFQGTKPSVLLYIAYVPPLSFVLVT